MASSSSTTRTDHLLPSSGNSTPASTLWDVFLSFRGIDTRTGFTSHLHSSLHRTGIRTFIDEPELRAGDVISSELRNAIKQSKVYIVVLSKNYASSGWCLDELVEILRCWKSMGGLVLPIFYNIEPSVVRHQIGSFKEAFEKHEGRVPLEILNKWKASLKEVADFSGYHLSDQPIKQTELAASGCELCENRHLRTEADTITDVVERVLLQINPVTLEVAQYPAGIDSRVEEIQSLLRTSSSHHNGVHWIGIYGMGGVGKTTLAKAFYNQMFRSFDGSCFLANIKDVCKVHKGLESLQQQFIDDVLKCKNTTSISSIDRGISLIRERICSLKVLVVFDDLDHRNQVDCLVGKFLAAGSLIVLTTRNEDLLDKLGVKTKYMVNILDGVESQQLFNQLAFGDTVVSSEFIVMSNEIQRYAGGLPLALTVFGSTLSNEDKGGWEWFMDKLKRVPIKDIEEKLMISFEALKLVDPILQDIFLDIACFFVGRCFFVGHQKAKSVKILQTCYKVLNHYISLLQKRCLITIQDNEILMHDLLRDMGRKIARNDSRQNEPEKHSRLFASEDIQDILENKKGTKAIECMVESGYRREPHSDDEDSDDEVNEDQRYSCDAETFDMMPNLRFLRLGNVKMRGSFGKPFKDLRWLSWDNCSNLPSNFCAQKLVILELQLNNICRFVENALVLGKLKILDMSGSIGLSKTPDFNGLPCLETLNLSDCESLVEVDISIGNLERLATLGLSFCKSLRSLPESICKLRALKTLNLSYCSSLEALPMELGNTESLTHLDALGTHILNLPKSIGRLSRLVRLSVSLCINPTTLPDIICKLSSLETLDIYFRGPEELASGNSTQLSNQQLPSTLKQLKADNCKSLLKLPDLSNLQQLVEMDLSGCSNLREVEGLEKFTSLEKLHLRGCTSIKRLPDLSDFQKLKYLSLQGCSILTEIEGLEDVLSLISIDLRGCISLKRFPNLSNLQQLQTLRLTNCSHLTGIKGLEDVLSITVLDLSGCIFLNTLPNLSKLQELWNLRLTDCSSLTEIHGLEEVISLTLLDLRGCTSLYSLPDLSKLQELQFLCLQNCSRLTEIEGFGKLISIEELHLEGCTSINRLPDLSGLQNLKSLRLKGSSSLREMEGLDKLISIEELHLEGCTSLKRLPDLSKLQELKTLELTNCSSLTEIQGLGEAVDITTFNCGGCKAMERLPNLSKLQKLEILQLSNCISLTEIQGLEEVISLTKLDLRGCISLYSLPDLSKLQKIRDLRLRNCSRLTEIQGFGKLISIEELHLEGCTSINRLPDLSGLQNLKSLRLKGSSSLREMEGLDKLISIEKLYLEGCTLMERLPDLSDLQKLKSLTLKGCSILTEIEGLEDVLSVTIIDLSVCISLKRFPNLSNLQQLQTLQLTNCSHLTGIEGLEDVLSITELDLRGCTSLYSLPDLSNLQKLKSLNLTDCSSLTEIQGLGEAIHITRLNCGGCKAMERLPNLSKLQHLEILQLSNCISLTKIQGLEEVISLTLLDLRGCTSLDSLPDLSKLQELKTLELTDCSSLTEIQGLGEAINITTLNCGGCKALERLPNLSKLQQLKIVHLSDCISLTEIQGLDEVVSLTKLDLRGCSCLTEIQALKRVAYLFNPSINTISVAAASSSEILDRAVSAVFLSGMNRDAKEANVKSKVWKLIEVIEPSMCRSTKHPDNMRETKISNLIYTNSGNAILALASNAIHLLWKWRRDDRNLCGKATASISPPLWRPSSGIFMTNEVTDANPEDALSCFALSKNDSYLISASGGKISLFNMITFKRMTTFNPSPPAATVLALYPQDNNIIAIGLEDSSIQIYNVRVDEIKSKLNGHSKRITGLSFSQVFNVLVSSGADAQLCVWSSDGWKKQNARYLQLPDGTIPNVDSETHVQFHLDQIHFLVVHVTQLAIYETEKLERLKQWVPQESVAHISHATFSCDSQLIYACFLDASLCVFTATDLSIRSRISPAAYLPPTVSTSSVHPLVIAAHPKEPNQIAVGLSDGGVCVFKPLESEDVPPPRENGSASSVPTTTADGASCSGEAVRPPIIATYRRRTKQIKELKTYQRRGKKNEI